MANPKFIQLCGGCKTEPAAIATMDGNNRRIALCLTCWEARFGSREKYDKKNHKTHANYLRGREADRERYRTDPEFRKKRQARSLEYNHANLARNRERYRTDPEYREKCKARSRDYRNKRYPIDALFRKNAQERSRKQRVDKMIQRMEVEHGSISNYAEA